MSNLSQINTNISALNALNALYSINQRLSVRQLRLATGKRVNSAADDAAGYTIAKKFKVRVEGLGVAIGNISDAKNLIAVGEGHLININDILQQMKAKVTQAASDSLGTAERDSIQAELIELNSQIDVEVAQAQWNGQTLFNSSADSFTFQIGAGTVSGTDDLTFDLFNSNNVSFGAGVTGYNSSGLNVSAGNATRVVSNTVLSGADYNTNTVGTTASVGNATIGELNTGHYTVEVSTTGAGSATGAAITVRVRDSEGNLVTLDADGAAGGDSATALQTTLAAGATSVANLNLGNGLDLTIGGIATANASTEGSLYSVNYTAQGSPVNSTGNAHAFMQKIDDAIDNVSKAMSYIGATVIRLSFQQESLTVAKTNSDAARSRIEDADMAYEQLEATKLQILQQTATAMLAQANVAPQSILALFR